LQSSITGEPGNTGREATLGGEWKARAQVFVVSAPRPLPPFRAPRLEEFPARPPIRSVLASFLLHLAAVSVVFGLLPLLPLAFPFNNEIIIRPEIRSDHIIYIPTPYLPQLQDSGGAESGKAGTPGGRTGHHPKQVIQVARGSVVVKALAEANLPVLPPAVPAANLVSFAPRAAAPALVSHQPVLPAPPNASARPISQLATVSAGPIVVPPPPEMGTQDLSKRSLVLPVVEVVAPAPSAGSRKVSELAQPRTLGTEDVIAPAPPNVSANINARTWETLPTQVMPPPAPPATKVAQSGERTTGVTSESNGDSHGAQQLVLSGSPGERVGVPAGAGSGSLALAPVGMTSPGLGGAEAGTGVGTGSGSGSGRSGSGSGAGASGSGLGASSTASGGSSPAPGPGGSGTGVHPGSMPGVSIQGGNVYVPSFATGAGASATRPLEHGPRRSPTITIVATARSGGALNIYGLLKGSKVYTVYLDTSIGPVVLQYAEQTPATRAEFNSDLSAPEPIDTSLPAKLPRAATIIACVLARDGGLRNIRVIKAGSADIAHGIEVALQSWRFRPARNGQRAVDVDAVLGFDIDTR
jgi:hypothetical protein